VESEALKYGWLIVLTLVQIIYVWMKIAEKRNEKKENPHNPSPPVDYHNHEGRISSVETGIGNIKESNERDHGLIRQDIQKLYNLFNRKIFNVLNGMKK
jgi:hypothetical protein